MKRFLISVTLSLITLIISAQEISNNFRQISLEQGLPGQNVRQIYQDVNGIIWISVEAIGLCRYDGHRFELFRHNSSDKESLSSNYVNVILEDNANNLWIATDKGLNKYNRNKNSFQCFFADTSHKFGLKNDLIHSLYKDRKGNFWVGTGDGLYKYISEENNFRHIRFNIKEKNIAIKHIFEHSNGLFYFGTNKGLFEFNPENFQEQFWSADKENGPVHQNISCITEDNQGTLWIGTHRGINNFDVKTKKFKKWEFLPEDHAEFENEGYNSVFNRDGRFLWFASYTSGIVIIDTKTNSYYRINKHINTKGSLLSNHIRHIYEDQLGLLWISTKFEGVFVYDSRKEMFDKIPDKYKLFEQIKNLHILSFYSDTAANYYWVGTKYNGLFRLDVINNQIHNFVHDINNPHSIANNRVHEIFRDSDNNLWVGLRVGLDKLDEVNGTFHHFGTSFVEDIKEDKQSNLWVGTTEGAYILDKSSQKLTQYKHENSFFSNDALQIMHIMLDKQGNIWFSTRSNGIFKFNLRTDKVTQLNSNTSPDGLFHGHMPRPVIEDNIGKIWIGTKANGINIYCPEKDKFQYFTMDDGLSSNFILCIQEDLHGNFWIGTHNGLSFYETNKNYFSNYSTVHGLQGEIFELGANGIFSDGCLFFGGHNGLNIFYPDSIKTFANNQPDSMLFTSVKVYDKEIIRDFSYRHQIDLNYKENFLSIEFIMINYIDPMKHQFKYRFYDKKNISDNWIDLGNKNYITLSGIQPGDYQLEILGINEFGVVSKKPLILDITIKAPLVESWVFRAVVFMIIAFVVLFISWNRINRSRTVKQYLENEIHERTEKLSTANEILTERNKLIEKQKLEIEKNKLELELKVKERTKDLEMAKSKAEESDRLKSSFIANMSHEIRTPLNAILGFSSLISDSVKDKEELLAYQESIDSNAEILVKIIDDVLDISKIEAKQLEVSKKEINLTLLLLEVLNIYQQHNPKSRNKKLDIQLNNPLKENEILFINSDPHRLKQILFNLIDNAIKFTGKGFVEFGFKLEDPVIQFYVKDTGIGIARQNFDAIFERFIKLENKEELYRGNGLGLPLCKSLVELLGGNIWVDSLLGHGTTFYFTLPNENYKLFTKSDKKSIKRNDFKNLIKSDKQILVVEDESSNFEYLEALLFLSGSNAIWARNGNEAIEMLSQNKGKQFSLILMDIKMPQMDGYKTFTKIRELRFDIPIVAVTAYAQTEDKDKIMQFGFNDYIAKPVNKNKLLSILQKHLK
jgi:signal transduction histidine kinase/ligand-binding sensor domain-containing protein/ActR/RegA family two-component response regulator